MTAPRRSLSSLLFTVLFTLPIAAWADAGTPLLWAESFHLVFGNTFIGIIEGLLIAWWFHIPKVRCIFIMIAANYFSAWTGFLSLTYCWDSFSSWFAGDPFPYRIRVYFWSMVSLYYLATILLEWPFCLWLMRSQDHPFRQSLLASVLAQTLSYALLVPFFSFLISVSF